MGLRQAFPKAEIIGVDHRPQRRYPFQIVQADAMNYPLEGFDFIWASPPCQGYSVMRHLPWNRHREYPMLIEEIRERLQSAGVPYVIENVMGARAYMDAHFLCGTMFGKRFYRHRLFESNFLWLAPHHPKHEAVIRVSRLISGRARTIVFSEGETRVRSSEQGGLPRQPTVQWGVPRLLPRHGIAEYEQRCQTDGVVIGLGHLSGAAAAKREMEVEWMSVNEMTQAIPPCYSRYLAQFIPVVEYAA